MDSILTYFPNLNEQQIDQLEKLGPLYQEWNQKINVISRKDIDNIYQHHILHSLLISKWISFRDNARILDLGTGGGFPGIPLAILNPKTNFHLVDSTKKKTMVAYEISRILELSNVEVDQKRGEDLNNKYDFILARAVARTNQIISWTHKLIDDISSHPLPNGWILLKGGNLDEELGEVSNEFYIEVEQLDKYVDNEYFREKYLVYVQK